jgi:hypothetical protein
VTAITKTATKSHLPRRQSIMLLAYRPNKPFNISPAFCMSDFSSAGGSGSEVGWVSGSGMVLGGLPV